MRRVVVIGATGHIGTYLVPRLVRAGYEVVAVSRGERQPYHDAVEWRSVARVTADRDVEEAAGTFGTRIADLEPEAVVDLICFTPESAARPQRRNRSSTTYHQTAPRATGHDGLRATLGAHPNPARPFLWSPTNVLTFRRVPASSAIFVSLLVPLKRLNSPEKGRN